VTLNTYQIALIKSQAIKRGEYQLFTVWLD